MQQPLGSAGPEPRRAVGTESAGFEAFTVGGNDEQDEPELTSYLDVRCWGSKRWYSLQLQAYGFGRARDDRKRVEVVLGVVHEPRHALQR